MKSSFSWRTVHGSARQQHVWVCFQIRAAENFGKFPHHSLSCPGFKNVVLLFLWRVWRLPGRLWSHISEPWSWSGPEETMGTKTRTSPDIRRLRRERRWTQNKNHHQVGARTFQRSCMWLSLWMLLDWNTRSLTSNLDFDFLSHQTPFK